MSLTFAPQENLVQLWRDNPSVAAHDLLHNPLSDDEDEQFELIPIQRLIVNRVSKARSSIVVACRGFGKTRMAATIAILQAWLNPGRRVGCLSASFRQSKQIFEEIGKIWSMSPLLQQCTERHPVISNDSCRLEFRPIPGFYPSTIRALPLADGSKIRGARFHLILVDEAVHVPEDVFQMVIRPMAATRQNPRAGMRIEREKDKIKALGLPSEIERKQLEELEKFIGANQIVMLTSGYYSFNYVYNLYRKYSDRMHGRFEYDENEDTDIVEKPEDYATFQIPHKAIPKGFLDPSALRDARRDMSSIQFRMEYEAAWILDTGGWFKASDIEACRSNNLLLDKIISEEHCAYPRGIPGKQYLMSIDPARTSDAFAIVISEFDYKFGMKIAHVEQYFNQPTPAMVRRIFQLNNLFNIIEIGIDAGGGGRQVADFLAEGTVEDAPLLDMDDDNYKGVRGKHIVKLIDFSSGWLEQANNDAYNMLQRRQMCFPSPYMGSETKDTKEREQTDNNVEKMIAQILSIEPSETRLAGKIRFDLPETGGTFVRHKDLYSAWLIGSHLAYTKLREEAIPSKKMPLLGIVTPRYRDNRWY
jgi:hypothetical protein